MTLMIILISFLPTLMIALVMSVVTRSAAIAVVGSAFLGISIRDVFFAAILHQPIVHREIGYYLGMLGMSLVVASFGTLVFSLGVKYVLDERTVARNWACTWIAVCCSIPLAIPTTQSGSLHLGVAPLATISVPAVVAMWAAFVVAVIGVIAGRRAAVLIAALTAVATSLATLSFGDQRNGGINLVVIPAVLAVVASLVDAARNREVTVRGDTLRMLRDGAGDVRR